MAKIPVKKKWVFDQQGSTWPICLEIEGDENSKSPIWVWGDIKLAQRVCRLLNREQMTKTERRDRIKQVYPLACEGDAQAISELANLLRRNHRKTKCFVCGQTIHTEKKNGEDARCMAHRKSNRSMKKTEMLS